MDVSSILQILDEHGVDYLVVGSSAAWLHGLQPAAAPTLEVCFRQRWGNCECLSRALDDLGAEVIPPRGAPIPLTGDLRRTRDPLRFETPAGPVSVLPAVPGLGGYDDLSPEATTLELGDRRVPVLALHQLKCWAASHPSCARPYLEQLLSLAGR